MHLPMHAACNDQLSCSDYVVSSYIPTLNSLISARKAYKPVSATHAKILLAAVPQPHVPVRSSLPSTVEEVHVVARAVLPNTIIPLHEDEDASFGEDHGIRAQTLLENLQQATILHLACHGLQDSSSPLKSAFLMWDGALSISDMMQLALPNAFFAFLSAGETAKGDKVSPTRTESRLLVDGFAESARSERSLGSNDALRRIQEYHRDLMVKAPSAYCKLPTELE